VNAFLRLTYLVVRALDKLTTTLFIGTWLY